MDMTPIIDVVFNLIIFFMVITDMSQKDLEHLILPRAPVATVDDGKDLERIVINIVDPTHPDNVNRVRAGWPPIFVEGRQMESLTQMRQYLRRLADPGLYPDREKPLPHGGYPSRKPVLVRCDRSQVFGWVQAVIQYCTFVPGRPLQQELAESPMIYKLEIAVAEKEDRLK
jgi:hypothetical protein